jgi:hypothetical protein
MPQLQLSLGQQDPQKSKKRKASAPQRLAPGDDDSSSGADNNDDNDNNAAADGNNGNDTDGDRSKGPAYGSQEAGWVPDSNGKVCLGQFGKIFRI